MVRVIIKGGVWRNTEDEVLKAAVMKYGKNQWSRVASLLHRKSAKQCKARWFEWLDPSIKKTDWSREEDEKLLHLAKLMPTQWRTIAPIVGRTASQCLERYEHLLDEAVAKAEGANPTLDDARRLRPGEIDPCPENKPARPDPVDMDEDELEMLSEARARLANTQGKKAKRKARERQLNEARRLAWLQKRRELRAAGIAWSRRGFSKGGIDYNEAPPFMRAPPLGFHNPSEDNVNVDHNSRQVAQKILKQRLEKDALAAEEKRKSKERAKRREKEGMTDAMFARLQAEKKRSKLVLPQPQITDAELENIVKIGRATNALREVALSNPNAITSALLPDFNATPRVDNLRTPMMSDLGRDSVISEAENLAKLQNLQTPLKGGLNPELTDSDFSSALPRKEALPTPNTVLRAALTPYNASAGAAQSSTPSTHGSSVAGTPAVFRDQFSMGKAATPSLSSKSARVVREKLRESFMSLPAPRNDFEVIAPDEEEEEAESDQLEQEDGGEGARTSPEGTYKTVPDQWDLNQQQEQLHAEREMALRQQQSQAVRRNLPRPFEITISQSGGGELSDLQAADEMIKREIVLLLHEDALTCPSVVQSKYLEANAECARKLEEYLRQNGERPIGADEMEEARQLLQAETDKVVEELSADDGRVNYEQYCKAWDECYSQLAYVPSAKRHARLSAMSKRERLESLRNDLEQNRDQMTKLASKAAKVEKKMRILIGGHLTNVNQTLQELANMVEKVEIAQVQRCSYEKLLEMEGKAVAHRAENLSEEVRSLENRERELQKYYGQLQEKLQSLTIEKQRRQMSTSGQPVIY